MARELCLNGGRRAHRRPASSRRRWQVGGRTGQVSSPGVCALIRAAAPPPPALRHAAGLEPVSATSLACCRRLDCHLPAHGRWRRPEGLSGSFLRCGRAAAAPVATRDIISRLPGGPGSEPHAARVLSRPAVAERRIGAAGRPPRRRPEWAAIAAGSQKEQVPWVPGRDVYMSRRCG